MKNTRAAAAQALAPVLSGDATLDEGLRRAAEKLVPRERALLRELCFGVCRRYQELDGLLGPLLAKPLKARDADVRALLLLGMYQLRCMRVPDHAAVAETVNACAALQKPWARGLVNAVLRSYQSRTPELEAGMRSWQRVSHPAWLVDALSQAWPQDIDTLLAANNAPGPLTLRVNLARGSRESWLARAAAAGLDARPGALAPEAVVLGQAVDVQEIPGFAEGEVSVQDEAAQLAAGFLDPQPGERILDACAAPGGKTGHLLERCSEMDLLALDAQPKRLERVRDNLERLKLQARLLEGDARHPTQWWDGSAFDAILVDAPCSGTGVIRRHPDIKLLRRPAQVREANTLQAEILDAVWPLLRPGGRLLYATCSVLPAENENTIEAFLARTPDARVKPLPLEQGKHLPHGLQLLPAIGGHDGFYYALLQKPPH